VEIDLAALADNARAIAELAGTALWAVVKADAYGHGAPGVATALEAAGAVRGFAVSLVEEGVQLRDAGVRAPILVMGPAQRGGHAEMVARGLTPVVSDAGDLDEVAGATRGIGGDALPSVHLKIDTGMSRLGVPVGEAGAIARRAHGLGLDVAGVMTHLANADVDDPADPGCLTWTQLHRFLGDGDGARATPGCVDVVRAVFPAAVRHAANSSGTMLFARARLDLVRVGLALYGNGAWSSDAALAARGLGRRQAMRFVTHVAQLRHVAPGDTVGYGALWRAARPTTCAILPAGYADGLPRRLGLERQPVLIRGRRHPLIGVVTMDQVLVDVGPDGDVEVGDEVVLLGAQGDDRIGPDDWAARLGTIAYEVVCGLGTRVERRYQPGGS
jgi:alanine racemase